MFQYVTECGSLQYGSLMSNIDCKFDGILIQLKLETVSSLRDRNVVGQLTTYNKS